jgi:hypothetical protein
MRRLATAAVLPLLVLTSCESNRYTVVTAINPPEAHLYVNGVEVGQGDSRPQTYDFAEVDRICVQATHPEYEPKTEWFDRKMIEDMLRTKTPLKLTLRQR